MKEQYGIRDLSPGLGRRVQVASALTAVRHTVDAKLGNGAAELRASCPLQPRHASKRTDLSLAMAVPIGGLRHKRDGERGTAEEPLHDYLRLPNQQLNVEAMALARSHPKGSSPCK